MLGIKYLDKLNAKWLMLQFKKGLKKHISTYQNGVTACAGIEWGREGFERKALKQCLNRG